MSVRIRRAFVSDQEDQPGRDHIHCGTVLDIFGFMFGSIFGFEDVIQARWLRPVDAMTNLPFIGQLNTVFVVAIAFGMGLNILVMIFNVINAVKSHDLENMLFSHNGIAGLVFYGFLVLTIVLYMTGHKVPGNIMMVIFLGVPVLLFVFKEPLGNLVTKQHKKMEEGKVMFFRAGVLRTVRDDAELFFQYHFLCAYRCICRQSCGDDGGCADVIGRSAGHTNWIVFVLGNVLVCGLKGWSLVSRYCVWNTMRCSAVSIKEPDGNLSRSTVRVTESNKIQRYIYRRTKI